MQRNLFIPIVSAMMALLLAGSCAATGSKRSATSAPTSAEEATAPEANASSPTATAPEATPTASAIEAKASSTEANATGKSSPKPTVIKRYKAEVVKTYPHSTGSYTQGLFFDGERLIESSGQCGESAIRELDLKTGKALQTKSFKQKYFLEGSVIFNGDIYVLTWTNNVAFVHDPETFEYRRSYSYPREGWGLTTDGKNLIASDGSSRIYFMDKDLNVTRTIDVTLGGRPRKYLNELEYIDGMIWANIYTSDFIVIIDPESGAVSATVDCSGISEGMVRTPRTDVLNGIAYDRESGKIYLTGKYWPELFEIRLKEIQ